VSKKQISCPEEFTLRADAYFENQSIAQKPFTLPGLARALGFSRVDTLRTYATAESHEEFHDVACAAKLRVEEYTAELLYTKNVNVAGPVFMLKNMGYTDKPDGPDTNITIKLDGVAAKL
jgi:hypothetical protein